LTVRTEKYHIELDKNVDELAICNKFIEDKKLDKNLFALEYCKKYKNYNDNSIYPINTSLKHKKIINYNEKNKDLKINIPEKKISSKVVYSKNEMSLPE
jgi:hypothetical protein